MQAFSNPPPANPYLRAPNQRTHQENPSSDLGLSFASTVSFGSTRHTEDMAKSDVVPMDISPEPSRFTSQFGGFSLEKTRHPYASTSFARLFGRDLSNEFSPNPCIASSPELPAAHDGNTQSIGPSLHSEHKLDSAQLQSARDWSGVVRVARVSSRHKCSSWLLCSWNMPLPHLMPWMSTPPLPFLLNPTPRLQLPSPLFQQCQASKIFLTTRPLLAVPTMTFTNPKTADLHPLKGPQNPRRAGAVRERSAFSIVHRPPWILPQVFSSWSVLQTSRKSPCLVVLECHLMITQRTQGSQLCPPWFHHPTHRSLVHPHHRETKNI